MSSVRDLVVLGGGPAGTAAALEARARGMDVVLVEARIRSWREQALVALAEDLATRPLRRAPSERRQEGYRFAVRRAGEAGSASHDQRDQRLARLGVARLIGRASLPGTPGLVVVESEGLREELHARSVLLASGSSSVRLKNPAGEPVEGDPAAKLLDDDTPPRSACVVGGGRTGVVLAGLLACAGTETWLVEAAERVLQRADVDIASAVQRALESAGVVLQTGTRVDLVAGAPGAWRLPHVTGAPSFERLYVTAGRRPDLAALGAELAHVLTPASVTSAHSTAWPWLFVAGAVTGRSLTAEGARRDGRAAVGSVRGQEIHVPMRDVPTVISGAGACGWAGLTEAEAAALGLSLVVGRSRLPGRGPLLPGFVKVVGDRGSRRLLGVHVAGQGREAVALGAALVELGVGLPELSAMAFPAGTAAEALAEAATTASAP